MKKTVLSATFLVGLLFMGLWAADGDQARKIDLNLATVKELESLPGIGPVTAERIAAFRKKNGPFKRIEDLMNVRGIGEKRFLKVRDRITVTAPPPRP